MDLGLTLSGVLLVLICALPFVWVRQSRQKKEKKLIQELFTIAEKYNCKIDNHEWWSNSIIGIDESKHSVFFIRKTRDTTTSLQVNLAESKRCQVNNSSRAINNKDGNYRLVEKLELMVTFKDRNKEEVRLEFYNANYDGLTLSGELQLIDRWCSILNDKISMITP